MPPSLRAHPLPTPSPEVDPEEQQKEDPLLMHGHERLRVRVIVEPRPPPLPSPPPAAMAALVAAEQHHQQPQPEAPRDGHNQHPIQPVKTNTNPAAAPPHPPLRPKVLVAGRSSPVPAPPLRTSFAPSPPTPHHHRPSPRLALLLSDFISAFFVYPLCVTLVSIYCCLALLIASSIVACVWPSLLLARCLYETLPFARPAFSARHGPVRRFFSSSSSSSASTLAPALLVRLAFEASHATALIARVLTLPLRPALPSLFLAGMAKCGTTTLAAYLKREGDGREGRPRLVFPAGGGFVGKGPAEDGETNKEKGGNERNGSKLLSLAALAEAASKETHFLTGALGRRASSSSASLYRSYYPLFAGSQWWRWPFWRRAVDDALGVRRAVATAGSPRPPPAVVAVDATPTYAALPFCARRMARVGQAAAKGGFGARDGARVVLVVRDPVDALASAEGMLRDLGALPARGWGLSEPLMGGGGGDEEQGNVGRGGGAGGGPHPPPPPVGDSRFADLESAARLWEKLERLPADAPVPAGIAARMCGLGGVGRGGGLGGPVAAAKAGNHLRALASVFGAGTDPDLGPRLMVVSFADLVERPERVVKAVLDFAAGPEAAAAATAAAAAKAAASGPMGTPPPPTTTTTNSSSSHHHHHSNNNKTKAFVPLEPRMTGGTVGGGGGGSGVLQIVASADGGAAAVVAAAAGRGASVAARPPLPVHPTVRARLNLEFAESARLLTELTGVSASVLLRRPVVREGGGGVGGGGA
jgi:hypothetical protein